MVGDIYYIDLECASGELREFLIVSERPSTRSQGVAVGRLLWLEDGRIGHEIMIDLPSWRQVGWRLLTRIDP